MKVVLFYPAFGAVGGAELLLIQHALCFSRVGHDVTLATFAFNSAEL